MHAGESCSKRRQKTQLPAERWEKLGSARRRKTKAQKSQGGDVKEKWWQGEKAGKWGAGVRKRGAAGGIRAKERPGISSSYSGWPKDRGDGG